MDLRLSFLIKDFIIKEEGVTVRNFKMFEKFLFVVTGSGLYLQTDNFEENGFALDIPKMI